MTAPSARVRTLRAVAIAALLGGLAALLALLLDAESAPHEVPVGLVAPGVVSDLLVEDVRDARVTPVPLADETAGRRRLEAGHVAAVVIVDLAATEDRVLIDPRRNHALTHAVTAVIAEQEAALGRTIATEEVGPSAPTARAIDRLSAVAPATGLLLAILLILARNGFPPDRRRLPRRIAWLTLGSLGIGALLAWVPPLAPAGLGAREASYATLALTLTVLAAALVTLALETRLRTLGIALAATLLAGFAAPALLHRDRALLPQPWRWIDGWTVPGAARAALAEATYGRWSVSLLALAAWALAGATVWAVTVRRLRTTPSTKRAVRTGAALASVAVLLLVASLLAGTPATTTGRAPQALATRTECVSYSSADTVAGLNEVAGKLRGSREFQGGDVGADALLQDGRRLWVFGDTLRAGGVFVRNSMLIFDDSCIAVVLPPGDGPIIPNRPASGDQPAVGYWPMSIGVEHREGYDLVAIGAQRVHATGTGVFDFETLGPAVALYVVPLGGVPQLVVRHDIGLDDADKTRPMWGAAAVVHRGWLYLYGTATTGDPDTFGYSVRVARLRPDDLTTESEWTFWDGESWVSDADEATELIPASSGTSQTLSVFRQGGTWYALSKRDDFLGRDLVVWTSPSPKGPFVAQPPLAELPSDAATGQLRYMPLAHPDLLPKRGTMVVSYSRNRTDVGEVLENPLEYRPRFLRVRLP